jgi:hypothetical protein
MSFIAYPNITKEKTEFSKNRYWYHEDIHARDILLVVAGDSWTWGDSLHRIDPTQGIYDDPQRLTSIYGHLLSEKLNSDFVNIAKCGCSNVEMHDHLCNILPHVITKYKKIYVVITLTENCRESSSDKIWTPGEGSRSTLDVFLKEYERLMFTSIYQNLIYTYSDVNFLIGRNFTYSWEENKKILGKTHLKKSWVDCLAEYQNLNTYPTQVKMVSAMAYVPLDKLLINLNLFNKFKFEFMKYYADAELAVDWLLSSDLNYKKATKHPTELGHKIWADYLYDEILKKNN